MYRFKPVHASLDELLLLEEVESMFYQMKISAAPRKALKLIQSLGAWNQIFKFLTQTECTELQLGCQYFYKTIVGRSHTCLRLAVNHLNT